MNKSSHSLYKTWTNMKMRCYWPEHPEYPRYGGRGIAVSEDWRNSFETFALDMGERPLRHSLDRIDVNGPYCKENCRWATPKQQSANRRNTRFVTIEGISYNLPELADKYGVCDETIIYRVKKGWSFDRVISKTKQWATGSQQGMEGRTKSHKNKREQTHCKRGHLLSGENLHLYKGKIRVCKACKHLKYLELRLKQKEQS